MNLEKIAEGFETEGCVEVQFGGYKLSKDKPLLSKGFYFCRGLILSDGQNTALAHIPPKSLLVDKYISDMSRDIGKPAKELKAAVIEAEFVYEQDLRLFCWDMGIKVVSVHISKFPEKRFETELEYSRAANELERNIAVGPKSQRVCISMSLS